VLEAKVHSGLHYLRRRQENEEEEEEAKGITFNTRKSANFCGLQIWSPILNRPLTTKLGVATNMPSVKPTEMLRNFEVYYSTAVNPFAVAQFLRSFTFETPEI
jgi:hypothetical protein